MRKVLSQKSIYEELTDVTNLARATAMQFKPYDRYKQCVLAFCDGLEFTLGNISKETAKKNIDVLINYLNGKVEELIFKHALIQTRC